MYREKRQSPRLSRFVLLLITLSFYCAFGASAAEQKFALVLANADYVDPRLKLENPINDGKLMASTLQKMGFKTWQLQNFSKAQFNQKLAQIVKHLQLAQDQDGPIVFSLFYAGHGIQYDRVNYLVPTDSTLMSESNINEQHLYSELVSLQTVTRAIAKLDNAINIVILDACRDLPFAELNNQIGGWTDIVEPGFFVAFGTGPGEQAFDGTGQQNSVFVNALVNHIGTPNLSLGQLFQRVRVDVMAATHQLQVPQESNRSVYDFKFVHDADSVVVQDQTESHWINQAWRLTILFICLGMFIAIVFFKIANRKIFRPRLLLAIGSASIIILVVSGPNFLPMRDSDGFESHVSNDGSEVKRKAENLPQTERLATAKDNSAERSLTRKSPVSSQFPFTDTEQDGQNPQAKVVEPFSQKVSQDNKPADGIKTVAFNQKEYIQRLLNQMVTMEAGPMQLGSNQGNAHSKPVVNVFAEKFQIMALEMTNNLYLSCAEFGPCDDLDVPQADRQRPISNVSFKQVTEQFLPWLNSLSEITFALPTELQWEYAAKRNNLDPFNQALLRGEVTANCTDCRGKSFGLRSAPVGTYTATPTGLFDVLGNVAEFTSSCWTPNYQTQYYGEPWPNLHHCDEVVVRGGAWHQSAQEISSVLRQKIAKFQRSSAIGFRLVIN